MNARTNYTAICKVGAKLESCTRCMAHVNGFTHIFMGKSPRAMIMQQNPSTIQRYTETFKDLSDTLHRGGLPPENQICLQPLNCMGYVTEENLETCRIINQFYIDNSGIDHILAVGKWSCYWFNYQSQWGDKKVYLMETFDKNIVSKFCMNCHEEFIPF